MSEPAQSTGGSGRVLLVIGVCMVGLTAVFAVTTMRSHGEYDDYHRSTLDDPANPPAWASRELAVEECVDEAIAWGSECPGLASWCQAGVPNVVHACLESADRSEYCESLGGETASTRFGHEECAARLDGMPEGKYAKRAAKKFCASSYRAIAGHCGRDAAN